MAHHKLDSDYGTGQKTLPIYIFGLVACIILSIVPYWAAKSITNNNLAIVEVVVICAIIQFLAQIICFLRLNTATLQAKMNTMSFIFTLVILFILVAGSIWIMINLDYNMMGSMHKM